MSHARAFIAIIVVLGAAASASADILFNLDFSGTAGQAVGVSTPTGNIAKTNSQFTFVNPAITFVNDAQAVKAVNSWVYDGTGNAAAQATILNTASANFGSTSRFDAGLSFAAPGFTYTITSLELDMRANNEANARFAAGFRDLGGTGVTFGEIALATHSGAAPMSYSIDVTSLNLFATSSTTSFGNAASDGIRFLFRKNGDTAGGDNFQVDAIRLIGTVTPVPEPGSFLLTAIGGVFGFMAYRRRRNPHPLWWQIALTGLTSMVSFRADVHADGILACQSTTTSNAT